MAEIAQIIGFLGAGRMATALARGCVAAKLVEARQVLAFDPLPAAAEAFGTAVPGSEVKETNAAVLAEADLVFLAVKPQIMPAVLEEIAPHVEARHLVVSIAAGVTLAKLSAALPTGSRLVRVMPNTPCLVGMGASCYGRGASATADDGALVGRLLASVGLAFEVEESQLDAVTGLSGSGPAFVYTMIESLAAGGEAMGLPAELALKLATQTTRGAAEMLRSTGRSPEELRQQVTSPGGTTLAGLDTLEKLQVTAAFRAAVESATRRSIELGQA